MIKQIEENTSFKHTNTNDNYLIFEYLTIKNGYDFKYGLQVDTVKNYFVIYERSSKGGYFSRFSGYLKSIKELITVIEQIRMYSDEELPTKILANEM